MFWINQLNTCNIHFCTVELSRLPFEDSTTGKEFQYTYDLEKGSNVLATSNKLAKVDLNVPAKEHT